MLHDLIEKIKSAAESGVLSKILLLLVAAGLSLFPLISIQNKLKQSLGNQPKILIATYAFPFLIIIFIAWLVMKTKPGNDQD